MSKDYPRAHRIIDAAVILIATLALGVCATLAVMLKPARAETAPTFRSPCWHCDDGWRPRHRHTRKVWRDDWREHEGTCKPRLAVVGDQYASEKGAREEADKAFMQTARWQHGERYMARENAADATYECGRSSVGSLVGQIFYRCRLTAAPCAPARSRAN